MSRHLRLLPAPRAVGATAIPSADLLALPARRGDQRAEVARLTLVIAEQHGIIADLQERRDEACEDRDAWRLRALAAEAAATRPSVWAALYAMCALGWCGFWLRFETPESLAWLEGAKQTA